MPTDPFPPFPMPGDAGHVLATPRRRTPLQTLNANIVRSTVRARLPISSIKRRQRTPLKRLGTFPSFLLPKQQLSSLSTVQANVWVDRSEHFPGRTNGTLTRRTARTATMRRRLRAAANRSSQPSKPYLPPANQLGWPSAMRPLRRERKAAQACQDDRLLEVHPLQLCSSLLPRSTAVTTATQPRMAHTAYPRLRA